MIEIQLVFIGSILLIHERAHKRYKNTNQYNYQIHYDSFDSNLKLNELDIINIYEIKNKKSKKDKDIQTKKEKIEVNYFIYKFNL